MRVAGTLRHRVAVVAGLLVVSLPVGCAAPAGEPPTPAPTSPDASVAPTLSATLWQSRMDLDDRQVQVKLRNDGSGEVVVERMALRSSAFDEPMVYRKRGSVLGAGRAVDMPVVLSGPVCGAAAGRHVAEVDYRLADGTRGTVEVVASDEHDQIAELHTAECFALEVAEVASLSVQGLPRVVSRDGLVAAELTVDVQARGQGAGGRELHLRHMSGTTLLQHVDPLTLERLPDGLPLDLMAPATGTRSFAVTLVPGRCDAHAIAEDKQGTRFRVTVDLDGRQGQVALVAPDDVKVALYDYVREACASVDTGGG